MKIRKFEKYTGEDALKLSVDWFLYTDKKWHFEIGQKLREGKSHEVCRVLQINISLFQKCFQLEIELYKTGEILGLDKNKPKSKMSKLMEFLENNDD